MSEGSIFLRRAITVILAATMARTAIHEQFGERMDIFLAPVLDAPTYSEDKAQASLHLEYKDRDLVLPTPEMPFLLRNSSANFFNHQIDPRRREFIQPQQASNSIAVSASPTRAAQEEAPLHLELKESTADAGAGAFQPGAFQPSAFQVRPQFFENPVPPFMPKPPNTLITILTPKGLKLS
jgi:hypothetical protein